MSPAAHRWRSLLFVPADDARRCAKACTVGADAVILDLEDGVSAANKALARERLAEAAAALRAAGVGVVVRINADWIGAFADVRAAVEAGAEALMVPKVEDAARLRVLGELLGECEAAACAATGATGLLALVESARGLSALSEIAAAARVTGLALGPEDFSIGMGVAPTPALLDLPSRQIALVASERGQMALAVPLSITVFRDTDAYAAAVERGAAWGVSGALCIHPSQVDIANRGFGPGEEAIASARRVLDAWEARADGVAVVAVDGQMIDTPVVEQARRLLARVDPR